MLVSDGFSQNTAGNDTGYHSPVSLSIISFWHNISIIVYIIYIIYIYDQLYLFITSITHYRYKFD